MAPDVVHIRKYSLGGTRSSTHEISLGGTRSKAHHEIFLGGTRSSTHHEISLDGTRSSTHHEISLGGTRNSARHDITLGGTKSSVRHGITLGGTRSSASVGGINVMNLQSRQNGVSLPVVLNALIKRKGNSTVGSKLAECIMSLKQDTHDAMNYFCINSSGKMVKGIFMH